MLQKTKMTLLRLFAVIAFVALFVFASISLASCSSDSTKSVSNMYIDTEGYLWVVYSNGDENNLGYVNGADGYEGSDGDNGVGISSITLDEATGELVITYDDDAKSEARVDISGYITSVVDSELASNECNHEYEDVMIIQAKDCGHDGLTLQRCVNCNNAIVVDDPATGNHTYDYDAIVWKWADDYSATVTVTCTTCGATGGTNGVVTVDATVASVVTTAATCDETGLMTYTATATLPDGNEYTDTVTAVIPTISVHIYVNSTTGDKTYIVMTEDGTYPAYVYIVDGTDYVMTGDEDPATYEELCDIFGADHLMVTDCEAGASLISQNAELVCSVCGEDFHGVTPAFNHSISETATIETHYDNGVAASMTPTCTDKGYYDEVYYCTVCGYEETRNTVEVAALGHNYVADTDKGWTWTPVYDGTEITGYEATLSFICSVCQDVHTETATVTSVHTSLTCQDNEADTYTATVTYEGLIYTTTYEVITTQAIGYHTAVSGLTFVLVDNFIYEYDTMLGEASADAMTVSEFLAAGGTMLTYGGEDNISYGYIYCTSCVSGTTTKVTVSLPKGGHHYAAVPETVDGKVSDVTWVWSADYSGATVYITCIDCGYVYEKGFTATVAVEPNQSSTGYIYTATYTYYGVQIFTDEVEIVTATANESTPVTLDATATSYVAQVEVVDDGYYAIEFNSTAAVITVTGSNGETYTTATAAALSKAVVLEETATVNYLLDANGNKAYILAGTTLYVSIELIDTTVSEEITVTYKVATAAIPEMTAGENYTVSLGGKVSLYQTTLTVAESGFYKVSVTEDANVTIAVWDDDNNYFYSTNWVSRGYITLGYIVDYNDENEAPISIAAGTVLNVAITYNGDAATDITALIEKADYSPEGTSTDVPSTVDYSIGLTTDGLEIAFEKGDTYTVYVKANGVYVFTCETTDGVLVTYTYETSYSDTGYSQQTDEVYNGSQNFTLFAGDTLTLEFSYDGSTTLTISYSDPIGTLSVGDNNIEITEDDTADGVEYIFTSEMGGTYTISVTGENALVVIGGTKINANNMSIEITLVAGQDYTFTCFTADDAAGSYVLTIECTSPTLVEGTNTIAAETDYTFTSEEGGTYTFTLSGDDVEYASVWAGEEDYNNSYIATYLDVQSAGVKYFTVTLDAGETITIYIAGSEKAITLTIAEGEPQGGDTDASIVPEALTEGANELYISADDAYDGAEVTFTATVAGTYTLSIAEGADAYIIVTTDGQDIVCRLSSSGLLTYDVDLTEGQVLTFACGTYSEEAATYTITITLNVEEAEPVELEISVDSIYNDIYARLDIYSPDVVLNSSDYTITYNGTTVTPEIFYYGDPSNCTFRIQMIVSDVAMSSKDDVGAIELKWYDADGNVVAIATYTPSTSGGDTETDPEEIAMTKGGETDATDHWIYWYAEEWSWGAGAILTDVTTTYSVNSDGSYNVSYTFTSGEGSNSTYAYQLFYNDTTNYTVGNVYVLTATITSDVDTTVAFNGKSYTLTAGVAQDVEIYFTYTGTSGLSLFDFQNAVTGVVTANVTITNITWTEATTTTYEFSITELAATIAEATSEETAEDKTQLEDSYFTGSNEFLTLETVTEQDQSIYRTEKNGCIQIKGAGLSVNFNYTGSITITYASTSGSNVSSIALVDSDGNYITATSTTGTEAYLYDGGGGTVIGTYYTVEGTTFVSVTFNVTSAGKYYITTNVGGEGRAARIQMITMTDYIVAEAE